MLTSAGEKDELFGLGGSRMNGDRFGIFLRVGWRRAAKIFQDNSAISVNIDSGEAEKGPPGRLPVFFQTASRVTGDELPGVALTAKILKSPRVDMGAHVRLDLAVVFNRFQQDLSAESWNQLVVM